jgi:hypothetical protein
MGVSPENQVAWACSRTTVPRCGDVETFDLY